jgi:hypothetical protein
LCIVFILNLLLARSFLFCACPLLFSRVLLVHYYSKLCWLDYVVYFNWWIDRVQLAALYFTGSLLLLNVLARSCTHCIMILADILYNTGLLLFLIVLARSYTTILSILAAILYFSTGSPLSELCWLDSVLYFLLARCFS